MPTFKEKVEIDAPDQVGLVVTGPVTGVGGGVQLTTVGTGGRGWEILATGQTSTQGSDKLNIRDLGNGQDVLTITSDGKVGIGTTNPEFKLEIDAPDELGLNISGPYTSVGAAVTLETPGVSSNIQGALVLAPSWQILATGAAAPQGSGKLNIASRGGVVGHSYSYDVFTITNNGHVGIGTTNPGYKLEIDAPDQLGLHISGPSAGVGAAISLSTINAGTNVNSWEILATGDKAAQGPDKLNIRNVITGEDVFTLLKGAVEVTGDVNISGDIKSVNTVNVAVDVILTGGDCAEHFDVAEAHQLEPGTVVVIDHEGALRESRDAYDKKVAGVVSGAGDYRPAIVLDKRASDRERSLVALVGKVYCKVDASYAPIEVGDLLTASPTAGHAMKATDPSKAFGAVIGKALRPLHCGKDLIPILVALQ